MIDILFEDNHLLVLNKPAGLLTQPSGTDQDSLEAYAKAYLKEKYQKPGNVFLEAVHRLDKPVGGIVVFAKTSKALSRLNATLRSKQVKKIYHASVEGVPKRQEAVLEHYLVHDDFIATVVSKDHRDAKLARLSYKILETKGNESRLEIHLETGRYHQIRAQLSAIGHPIVGDAKYGSKINRPEIALKHVRLEIEHPVTHEQVVFTSDSFYK